MLPLVSNDASAILFMFDLTRKTTLNSVKEWYRQARGFNKVGVVHFSNASAPLLLADSYTDSDRYQIRLLHRHVTGGAGGGHQTGQTVFQGYARPIGEPVASLLRIRSSADLLLDVTFHQRAKDIQNCASQSV